jgi:hypothetical protein
LELKKSWNEFSEAVKFWKRRESRINWELCSIGCKEMISVLIHDAVWKSAVELIEALEIFWDAGGETVDIELVQWRSRG